MYLGIGLSGFTEAIFVSQLQLSLGHFLFFILLATEFFVPIREQSYGMHLVMMNTKIADRIFSFLDSEVLKEKTEECHLKSFDNVLIKQLSFQYDETVLINGLNVKFERGKITAIVGKSGLGKSTLSQLLQGNQVIPEKTIFLGDQDISYFSREQICQEIICVSNNSYLFNKSIYFNLTLGSEMTKSQLIKWLEDHQLLQFIWQLPDGIDTNVGENGTQLSTGQRQQLLCVRALLAKRSLYIFDEVTSSVDSETEQSLLKIIKLISKKAIVVFITHKTRLIKEMNHVIYFDPNHSQICSTANQLYRTQSSFRDLADWQERLEESLDAKTN